MELVSVLLRPELLAVSFSVNRLLQNVLFCDNMSTGPLQLGMLFASTVCSPTVPAGGSFSIAGLRDLVHHTGHRCQGFTAAAVI